jgi:carbon-monoxide dehydrogenase large subunit
VNRLVGQRIGRVNDGKALRGRGRYVDDLHLADTHAAIVRSPVAHGVIRGLEVPDELPDGVTVLGPAALNAAAPGRFPVLWWLGEQTQHHTELIGDRVRYVGQPVAIVVAASRYQAEDAADRIEVVVDELDVVTDPATALEPGAPLLYPDLGSNVLCTVETGDDETHTDAVFAAADRTLSTTLRIGRVNGLPMEARGIVAEPLADGRLVVHVSTQAAHAIRDGICEVFEIPQHMVRVVTPDVGGGFGLKDHLYEDEAMVIAAARSLGMAVSWTEDRHESLTVTTHARDEIHDIDVAFDHDGTLRGLRVSSVRNAGGRFAVFGGGPLFTALGVLPGPYRWEAVRGMGRVVATNTMSTGAYRGFGQTQAVAIRERAVELVARELDMDPVELRAANMIGADELPYEIRTRIVYDNGDYLEALRRARAMIDDAAPPPDDGRRRGIGWASYVQLAGVGPSFLNEIIGVRIGGFESAEIRMDPDGSVRIFSGVSPHGQGHETTFAQLVADELGVDLDAVTLVTGDTDSAPYSAYGTAASRSIAVGGGAAVVASRELADKIRRIAAEHLEANPADIELGDGTATVVGSQVSVPIAELAKLAWRGLGLPDGDVPGLTAAHSYDPASGTFSYATHACRVAVDPDTGTVEVEDYVVVQDCGTMVNPTIVEGQIVGGIAQGLGAALMEKVSYDELGQPTAATLLDYHTPVSASMPDVRIDHLEIPSPYTPGGMKGMGEGGTNGAYSCVLNAVYDAVPELGSRYMESPLTAPVIWEALRGAPASGPDENS